MILLRQNLDEDNKNTFPTLESFSIRNEKNVIKNIGEMAENALKKYETDFEVNFSFKFIFRLI